MKMNKEDFIKKLIKESSKQNIELEINKANKMYEYKELLLEWNEKINLTAITEDTQIIMKHFVDSLLLTKYIESGKKIIDVGTGAGFPGVVLAIYFDGNIDVTLLDSLNKRIDFLDDIIKKLNIKNIFTVHARAEDFAHKKEFREKYDIAVARAVAPLNILLEYMIGYVKSGGQVICMKAKASDEEINNSKNAMDRLYIKIIVKDDYSIVCDSEEQDRSIIILEKQKLLDAKYPRNFAKIKKNPL